MRVATVERNTKETQITGRVDLDGAGNAEVSTGIGFLNHMLEQLAKHSLIDISLHAVGDLHIDFHHTTEDTGYVVGEAVSRALGNPAGVTLHVENLYGENNHHIVESCFKGLARALRQAVEIDPRRAGAVPSTKGVLGGSLP